MNIKSTKNNPTTWVKDMNKKIIEFLHIDTVTFWFSLSVGLFIGILTVGLGHLGPILTTLIIALIIAIFGLIDSGAKGFGYIIRLGTISIVAANLLVLYPASTTKYPKYEVIVDITKDKKDSKKLAVKIFSKQTMKKVETEYYPIEKRELVDKLFKGVTHAQFIVNYSFPIFFSKKLHYSNE